jgi:hypothetical protein
MIPTTSRSATGYLHENPKEGPTDSGPNSKKGKIKLECPPQIDRIDTNPGSGPRFFLPALLAYKGKLNKGLYPHAP